MLCDFIDPFFGSDSWVNSYLSECTKNCRIFMKQIHMTKTSRSIWTSFCSTTSFPLFLVVFQCTFCRTWPCTDLLNYLNYILVAWAYHSPNTGDLLNCLYCTLVRWAYHSADPRDLFASQVENVGTSILTFWLCYVWIGGLKVCFVIWGKGWTQP